MIDEVTGDLNNLMVSCGESDSNRNRIRLAMEFMLLDFLDEYRGSEVLFRIYKKWGTPQINVSIKGKQFVKETVSSDYSDYADRVMESLDMRPSLSYKDGYNHLTMNVVKRQSSGLKKILVSIILAVVLGLSIRTLTPSSLGFVSEIINPLFSSFMGILSTISGPMVFLSVSWGIYSIGDVSALGVIGRKMMIRFVIITELICAFGYALASRFFALSSASSVMDFKQLKGVYLLILEMFPSNIVTPFTENNAIQIIIIAIAMGVAMIILENKATAAAKLIEQSNYIVRFLMNVISHFVPLFVFLSLFHILISNDFDKIFTSGKILMAGVVALAVSNLLMIMYVSLRHHVSPLKLISKLVPAFPVSLTTASSSAAMGTTVDTCERKLGIRKRLINFGVPLGTVMYMPAAALGFEVVALSMAELYGISVSLPWALTLIFVAGITSIAMPPIPGGALTVYTTLFSQLGIPGSALTIALLVDVFLDFLSTAFDNSFL